MSHRRLSASHVLLAVSLLAVALPASKVAATDAPQTNGAFRNVVQRHTDDRQHDLIGALLEQRRHAEAIAICQAKLKQADPQSDDAAKWAIRWSQALTHQIESTPQMKPAAVAQAEQPVRQLQQAYPQHRRKWFLKAQLAEIQASMAQQTVVIASVSPNNNQQTEAVFRQLAEATNQFTKLARQVKEDRIAYAAQADSREDESLALDLQRLHDELQVEIVGLALLQTDVFDPESRDQISAASKARQAAEEALAELAPSTPASLEIERLRVQAILRTGDFDLAEQSLGELASRLSQPIPDRFLALRINLDLAQGELNNASKRLQNAYGKQPAKVTRSLELDLARLAYLIAAGDKTVGKWLEAIDQRHGVYGRRRAEAISLGNLRAKGSTHSIDPAIIAAQGADWLRRGDPARGAELLAAAAKSEPDGKLALRRSLESAAAYLKADRADLAADVLSSIAMANPTTPNSADTHLQSAMVLSQSKLDDASQRIESSLLQLQKTWPNSDAAAKARRWLLDLLQRQNRHQEAAKVATSFLTAESSEIQIDAALNAWMQLMVNSPADAQPKHIVAFERALGPLLDLPRVAKRYPLAAVYLLEPNSLSDLPPIPSETIVATTAKDQFAVALLEFRRDNDANNPNTPDALRTPSPSTLDVARWRLMRDGKQIPARRKAIAKLLSNWSGDWSTKIPLLIWEDRSDEAFQLAQETAAIIDQPSQVWKQLAEALDTSVNELDQQRAVEVWDQLSSGLPKSSPQWHIAKLAAIELLMRTGKSEEAARRAKYILLTNSPQDPLLRKRYESATSP